MTDGAFRFVVPGKPNGGHRIRIGGRRGYLPESVKRYREHVMEIAFDARPKDWSIDKRYRLTMRVYYPDNRVRDNDNVQKNIQDALKLIAWRDDSHKYLPAHSLESFIDPENPRVEVEITLYVSPA